MKITCETCGARVPESPRGALYEEQHELIKELTAVAEKAVELLGNEFDLYNSWDQELYDLRDMAKKALERSQPTD